MKSKSRLGKNSRGLAKHDQHSSSIGLVDNLSCLRDQQIQVTDLVDVNDLGFSEGGPRQLGARDRRPPVVVGDTTAGDP